MAKLRDLISESKYLKREFGEPLPTFKDVMEKHQINKLKENWWDDLSDEAQAAYIEKHGEAPNVAGGGEPEDKPHGGDTGKDADYGPEHPDNMDDDELKQFLDKDAEEDEGEPYKREPFQPGDDPEELSLGAAQDELEKAQAEMAHAEEMGDKAAYADAEEKEYALQVRLGITGRTGNELNQETLTIDGKQYRRISEGVEKQPKPKYAFSEFYERFKK